MGTLGLNLGSQLSYLHHTCGWTFWSDQHRLRWDEPITKSHNCNTHIWFHHLTNRENKKMRYRHVITNPFNATTSFLIRDNNNNNKGSEKRLKITSSVNHTGCNGWRKGVGLPPMKNIQKISFREGQIKDETNRKKRLLFKKSKLIEVDFSKPIPPCDI